MYMDLQDLLKDEHLLNASRYYEDKYGSDISSIPTSILSHTSYMYITHIDIVHAIGILHIPIERCDIYWYIYIIQDCKTIPLIEST